MPYYSRASEDLTGRADEELWQQHRERVQSFFADAGIAVEFTGVAGQPAEEIVEVAEQQQADLIVVGTREPGFVERLLGGSVSQGVARRAHCDVLIVHPQDEEREQ
jgi:nucleotide-binding universal stress UspA family protein